MINYDLPKSVTIDGIDYPIRNDGDYRVILDIIAALHDEELNERQKAVTALWIFYGDNVPQNMQAALSEMMRFINLGEEEKAEESAKPPVMDWEQDFMLIVPPINKALGFEVRAVQYLHWWTFVSGYQEMDGENTFSTVVKIRKKRQNGEKLDKAEQKFFNEHRDLVILRQKLSDEEKDFLFADD